MAMFLAAFRSTCEWLCLEVTPLPGILAGHIGVGVLIVVTCVTLVTRP